MEKHILIAGYCSRIRGESSSNESSSVQQILKPHCQHCDVDVLDLNLAKFYNHISQII